MRLVAALLVAATLTACSGSSSTFTVEAVPVPDLPVVAQVSSGEAELFLLADGDCFRLLVEVDGRRQVDTEDRCTPGARSSVTIAQPEVIFNDRDRTRPRCDDNNDCAGFPADAELPGPVLYGRLHPPADLGCIDVGGFASGLLPDGDGYVLTATTSGRDVGSEPVYFLDDGRFVGADPGTTSRSLIDACRSVLELPTPDIPAFQWFVHVEVAGRAPDDLTGVSLLTDTGFDAEGASTDLLADGHVLRVLLHPDTRALLVSFERERSSSRWVGLPPEVVASLQEGTPCGMHLTLEVAADLDVRARSDCRI